jgi:hypothetical protein
MRGKSGAEFRPPPHALRNRPQPPPGYSKLLDWYCDWSSGARNPPMRRTRSWPSRVRQHNRGKVRTGDRDSFPCDPIRCKGGENLRIVTHPQIAAGVGCNSIVLRCGSSCRSLLLERRTPPRKAYCGHSVRRPPRTSARVRRPREWANAEIFRARQCRPPVGSRCAGAAFRNRIAC